MCSIKNKRGCREKWEATFGKKGGGGRRCMEWALFILWLLKRSVGFSYEVDGLCTVLDGM